MVTATDFWSARVLGTSFTAAWPSGPAASAAATAVHNFLSFMGFSLFWLGCVRLPPVNEGASKKGQAARLLPNEQSPVGRFSRRPAAGRLRQRPHFRHGPPG